MQSYIIKTSNGRLSLIETSALLKIPVSTFIPGLNWLLIEPAKDSIGIDQIKESLKWLMMLKPDSSGKIILINRADSLTIEAQNALLKNLEDPGANNRFLLATANPATLIDTIVSRCQTINYDTRNQEAQLLANNIILINEVLTSSVAKAYTLIEKAGIAKNNSDTCQFILDLVTVLKKNNYAKTYKYNLIKQASEAIRLINQNVNSRIVLETFLLDLPPAH